MTLLTPKFDFPKPEGTDLISNGYDAIADLADSVDALLGYVLPHRVGPGAAPAPTAYVPTWTGATGNPVLGNGSIGGTWYKLERLVFFEFDLTFGSTTTQGAGLWSFGLPPAAGPYVASVNEYAIGRAALVDTSAAARLGRDILLNTSTTFCLISEAGAYVQPTAPWTWATGDSIRARGIALADS